MAIDMKPIYLYVVPFFPSPDSWRGGFFYDAVKAIMRDGRYDLRVMVGTEGEDYEIDSIKVYRFKRFKLGASDYLNCLTDIFKIRLFYLKILDMGVDLKDVAVCHVHLLERYAIYAAWVKKMNPKCFTMLHHHWTGSIDGLGYVRFKMLPFVKEMQYLRLRHSYEMVDAHVFCSNMARNGYARYYPNGLLSEGVEQREQLICPSRFRAMRCPSPYVVYNGIDSTVFNVGNAVKYKKDNVYRIGCVSNYLLTKSQITLLRAFASVVDRMPEAKLLLVGSGRMLISCKAFVERMGLSSKVEFISEMPHDTLPDFYHSLDLYVLPSYYVEAFNCTLIEAWACGVPCMATDSISFKEVLPHEEWSKWLFPAKNEKVLAEKLLWAYETRPSRQCLSHNLDIDEITRNLLDWVDTRRGKL